MENIPSYPKVHALGHRRIQDILLGEITIEEKIDGSQFSFADINGELKLRSKGQALYVDNPEKMFAEGIEVVNKLYTDGKLVTNAIYRSEYLKKPKHNCIAYDRIPHNHIIVYDVQDIHGNCLHYKLKEQFATDLGLETVPNYRVNIDSTDTILRLLENVSVLGGSTIEGIVVKNYDKWTDDGKFMAGKYVSELFKEKNQSNWKSSNPSGKDFVQILIAELKTEARWHKAVIHLKEKGLLKGEPQDIGMLLKELHQDLVEEESEYIKETLYAYHIKNIKRGISGGFPEWYKKELLKGLEGRTQCPSEVK